MPHHRTHQSGFTLIELLVVLTLAVILLLTATSMFLAVIVSNAKSSTTQKVKEEGDYAMGQMEFLLRNALKLEDNGSNQICESNMSRITFRSLDNGVTSLFRQIDASDNNKPKIASNSATYLTSGSFTLTNGPTFDCQKSNDGLHQYVTISFTLRAGNPSTDEARDVIELPFTQGVKIRSY